METFRKQHPRLEQDFAWVTRISWLMDDKFRLPGTRFRFGLDPLINLIPFLGDIIGFAVSFVLVYVMWRNGASRKLIMLMLINIVVDLTIGAIPIIGNVFDFFFKANKKNIILLREFYFNGKHHGKGNDILAIALGIFLVLTFLFLYILWKGFIWLVNII